MAFVLLVASQVCIALLFALAVRSKVWTRDAFRSYVASVRDFQVVPPDRAPAAALVVLAAEASSVVLTVWPGRARIGLVLATSLLGGLTLLAAIAVRRRLSAPCRCFGSSSRRIDARHVVRNALATAIAAGGTLLAFVLPTTTSVPHLALGAALGAAACFVVVRFDDLADLFLGPSPVRS
jgi:hypothetical protein